MQELKVKSKLWGLKVHHSTKSLLVPEQGRDLTFGDPRQQQTGETKCAQPSFTPPYVATTAGNRKGNPVLESLWRKFFASSKMNNIPVP